MLSKYIWMPSITPLWLQAKKGLPMRMIRTNQRAKSQINIEKATQLSGFSCLVAGTGLEPVTFGL